MNTCENHKDLINELDQFCPECKKDLRSEIPDTDKLKLILKELKDQFEYSLENIQNLEFSIDQNENINNPIEKTDYMDLDECISYLIQDFRLDDQYSPLSIQIQNLKNFNEILENFESTDYLSH